MDVLSDVLAATRIGGVLSARLSASAPWGLRMGTVPTAAFHAVTQGACWLRVEGSEPRQLVAGDVVLLPTGGGHALASDPYGPLTPYEEVAAGQDLSTAEIDIPGPGPSVRIICGAYRYDAYVSHPLLTILPPVLHLPADQTAARGDLATTLGMLASELGGRLPGSQTIVDRLVDVLFVHILRQWINANEEPGASWLVALRDPEIALVISLMHRDPARAWTVEGLARAVGVSRATLARRFTALVGEPPLAYLTRWRVELAARRLRDTGDPLSVIARSVGYVSEFSLSRAFSRARGVAPGHYRAGHRV
ncbi:AraC family transcriptional regulator [Streptosporangium roseum]|uniref:AraC family transcriptional regulator n=1 Tax=Streptosporangium roseum TaxID=2001 RepID=UPI0004CC9E15|nr:AraC family transcriptional regulator [Streptosporangium roseum]